MKLEIGGGIPIKARGGEWINIDLVDNANIRHDLNILPWPIAADSISEVYSSHCLEHLHDLVSILNEIARICSVGAPVELRVPHPSSDLAMVADHKHVFSPVAAINMDKHFPAEFWNAPKRLKLEHIGYGASFLLDEAKRELPFLSGLSDETIMKFIPRTAHECIFKYVVVENELIRR